MLMPMGVSPGCAATCAIAAQLAAMRGVSRICAGATGASTG